MTSSILGNINAVWKLTDLRTLDKAVLAYLATRADNDGQNAWPSYATIAQAVGCSRRRAIDAIDRLIDAKYLSRKIRRPNGQHISNIFSLILPRPLSPLVPSNPLDTDRVVVPVGHQGSDVRSPGVVTVGHQGSDVRSPYLPSDLYYKDQDTPLPPADQQQAPAAAATTTSKSESLPPVAITVRVTPPMPLPSSALSTTMRSRHPMFKGQRITVFDFHFDDLVRLLGTH